MMRKLRRPARPVVNAITRAPKDSTTAQHYTFSKGGQLLPRDNVAERALDAWQRGLLKTPACLVAGDDDHVVLAIGIGRTWLRDNHHLLAALSDAAAC
jgi:hypothetical protein